jgi:hypothetical protein
MDLMKGSERKKLERSFKSTPNLGTRIGELSLSYPAADLVPVAVFR